MTDKFDGKLWKWLLEHVLGKLVPSAADETAGKVLATDGEGGYGWSVDATGRDVPAGGTAGQVLTATGEDDGYGWEALPEVDEVPDASEASAGDLLTADGDGGYAWAAPAGGCVLKKMALVYNDAFNLSSSQLSYSIGYGSAAGSLAIQDAIDGVANPLLVILPVFDLARTATEVSSFRASVAPAVVKMPTGAAGTSQTQFVGCSAFTTSEDKAGVMDIRIGAAQFTNPYDFQIVFRNATDVTNFIAGGSSLYRVKFWIFVFERDEA